MELTEVAPGIDIERDILGQMGLSRSCTIRSRWTRASSASP
jgi:acyl CoA:acetate/3-ketoacid CoA transferase